jgi:tetratricopeptide (TPR) repeat protein
VTKTKPMGKPTPPRRLVEQTQQAYKLLESGHAVEALPILEELDRTYPNQPEVLRNLVNAYHDLGNLQEYEKATWQLSRLEPRNPELQLALASAYLANQRLALAVNTLRTTVSRWPNHPQTAKALESIKKIEKGLEIQANELKQPLSQALDLLVQNDELQFCLAHADHVRGRQVAEKLLRSYPKFVPALNNLCQIYAIQGDMGKAIQMAQQILTREPDNIHALSNLTRLNFLTGKPLEAQEYANKLKQSTADAAGRWTKIAEALAFLEDDQGILNLYEQAKAAKELEPPYVDEIFYHLLAVANWQLDNKTQARGFWEKAIRINPSFDWARENLEDVTKNIKNRRGVWTYPFENWLLARASGLFERELPKFKHIKNKAEIQAAFRPSVEKQLPEVLFLAKHLVERGDAKAAAFVVRMAAVTAHPFLVEAARAYIFGSRGTFEERFELSQILSEADLLSSGPVRMWNEGKWQDVMILSIEISPEPEKTLHSRAVQKLHEESHEALANEDGQHAQEILEKAVALAPDDPSLLNNLAIAHQMQGHEEIARRMIMEVHTRFPDYFFGIIAAANIEAEKGNLDKAHEMLNGLMQRKKLHTSEFRALCHSQIQISLADKNKEAARTWLEMWERVEPDEPGLAYYHQKVGNIRKTKKRDL